MTIAAFPSPSTAVWYLGPFPVRAYALCIVVGIVVAAAVAEVRLRRRGATPYAALDIALWAVPFGIVGARIYHLITSPQAYFGPGGDPWDAVKIWHGGLGIWGAVIGGAVGAWLACRQQGIPLGVFADALAPGLPLAQAVGRLGNWFNNELHGGPTTLPWGLEIHRMDPDNVGKALRAPDGSPELLPGLYHPTFAYEALWNVGVAALVLVLDRRFRFGRGRAFALYVMGYTVGRFWIELMRADEANEILGARVNVWVSVLVFLGALAYFLAVRGARQFVLPVGRSGDKPGAVVRHVAVSEAEFEAHQRDGVAGGATAGGDSGDGDGGAAGGAEGDGGTDESAAGDPSPAPVAVGAATGGSVAGWPRDAVARVAPGGGSGTAGAASAGAASAGAPGSVGAEGVAGSGGADDDTDDGADLVDASMPPLDDFADDETDDETEQPEDDEDDETDGAGPVGSAGER